MATGRVLAHPRRCTTGNGEEKERRWYGSGIKNPASAGLRCVTKFLVLCKQLQVNLVPYFLK
jgi:hypothetical protein